MNQTTTVQTKRKSYLDLLRILACYLVIFNHMPGNVLYEYAAGPVQWVYMLRSAFTTINVPLFFMISGALLLPREESLAVILKKRVGRMVLVVFIFTAVTALSYDPWGKSLREFVRLTVEGSDMTFSYWFLYAYIGFLLLLPFMRSIAGRFGRKEFQYLLGLHVLFCSVWAMLNALICWLGKTPMALNWAFSIPLVDAKAFFYPLMGYYLDHVLQVEKLKKKQLGLLIAAALLGLLLSAVFTYGQRMAEGTFTEDFIGLFDYLSAIAVFVTVKYLFVNARKGIGPRLEKLLAVASSLTFGVYLLDPLLKEWIYWPVLHPVLDPVLPKLLLASVWCVVSMAVGGGLVLLLKKIAKLL